MEKAFLMLKKYDESKVFAKVRLVCLAILALIICFVLYQLFQVQNTVQSGGSLSSLGFGYELIGFFVGLVNNTSMAVTLGTIVTVVVSATIAVELVLEKKRILRISIIGSIVIVVGYLAFAFLTQGILWKVQELLGMISNGNFQGAYMIGSELSVYNVDSFNWVPVVLVFLLVISIAVIALCAFDFIKRPVEVNNMNFSFINNIFVGSSKKMKMVVSAVVVVVVLVSGVLVYFQVFHKTQLDAFAGLEVVFEGVDGHGTAEFDRTNIQTTDDVKLNDMLRNVAYEFNKKEALSNGDVITVTIVPDLELLEKYKIEIPVLTKEYTVDGLRTIPQTYSDISDIDRIDQQLRKDAEDDYDNLSSSWGTSNYSNSSIEVVAVCWGNNPKKQTSYFSSVADVRYGTVLNIYKISYDYKLFSKTENRSYFVGFGVTNITLDKDGKVHDSYTDFEIYNEDNITDAIKSAEKYNLSCE